MFIGTPSHATLRALTQNSDAWARARRGKIGGSSADTIVGTSTFKSLVELQRNIRGLDSFTGNAYTAWGHDMEDRTQQWAADTLGTTFTNTGIHPVPHVEELVFHNGTSACDTYIAHCARIGGIAASPDAMETNDNTETPLAVMEIKNPATTTLPKAFAKTSYYWAQVALERICMDRKRALFVVATPLLGRIEEVPDPTTINTITPTYLTHGIVFPQYGGSPPKVYQSDPREHRPPKGHVCLTRSDLALWTDLGVYDPTTHTCPGFNRVFITVLYYFWRGCQDDAGDARDTMAFWDAWAMGGGVPSEPWHWEHMVPARRLLQLVLARCAMTATVLHEGPTGTTLVPAPITTTTTYIPPPALFRSGGGWPAMMRWQQAWFDRAIRKGLADGGGGGGGDTSALRRPNECRKTAWYPFAYIKAPRRTPFNPNAPYTLVTALQACDPKGALATLPPVLSPDVHVHIDIFATDWDTKRRRPTRHLAVDVRGTDIATPIPYPQRRYGSGDDPWLPGPTCTLVLTFLPPGTTYAPIVAQRVVDNVKPPPPMRASTMTQQHHRITLVPGYLNMELDAAHTTITLKWAAQQEGQNKRPREEDGDIGSTSSSEENEAPFAKVQRTE